MKKKQSNVKKGDKNTSRQICSDDKKKVESAVYTCIEKSVLREYNLPKYIFRQKKRGSAQVTRARQIAMYLAHVTLSISKSDISRHYHRDQSTVAYACRIIEEERDKEHFDLRLQRIEQSLTKISTSIRSERLS